MAALQAVDETPKKKGGRKLAMPKAVERELWYRPTTNGWTPERVINARSSADAGNMRELADLVETIVTDDRVSGVLSTRTHGLLGLPITFKRGSSEAREMLAGDGDEPGEWWSMHNESELAKLARWGLLLGFGLAQRIPLPRVLGRPQRYRIETWSPRWLYFDHFAASGVHWRMSTMEGWIPVIPGDGEWILYQPYGARRPWAEGLWTQIVFPWLLKRFSLEDRANYSEVLGSPLWVALTSPGSTEKQRNRILSQMVGTGKNGKFVLPNGWDLKLIEATGKSYEIYETSVEWADTAITVALAGQVVTTEGTPGFSSGNIHEAIKQDLIRFDAERLATCLREQSLEPWARLNYGTHAAAPWPQWQIEKPEDVTEKAQGLSAVADAVSKLDAALKVHGFKVNAEQILADYNIPVLQVPPEAPPVPAPAEAAPTNTEATSRRMRRKKKR